MPARPCERRFAVIEFRAYRGTDVHQKSASEKADYISALSLMHIS
jgi:hypothetical protein